MIAGGGAVAVTSSTRNGASRRLSSRARSHLWTGMQQPMRVNAKPAVPVSPPRAEVGDREAPAHAAPRESREPPANASPPREAPAKQATRNERVELAIDSLQNYELVKPIPVIVESLGDKIFTAEAVDLNLSMSENSLGGALLLLKDRITTIYEEYRMKKTMSPEETRRFEVLQMYIGKTRRNWR